MDRWEEVRLSFRATIPALLSSCTIVRPTNLHCSEMNQVRLASPGLETTKEQLTLGGGELAEGLRVKYTRRRSLLWAEVGPPMTPVPGFYTEKRCPLNLARKLCDG